MKRTVNIGRLKSILQQNLNVRYHETQGVADDDFIIYLTNGQQYLVKEGYFINWSDDEEIKIQERALHVGRNMDRRMEKEGDFFDKVGNFIMGAMENIGAAMSADTVDIEWAEIRDIQSV
jgi:hypothetical protein